MIFSPTRRSHPDHKRHVVVWPITAFDLKKNRLLRLHGLIFMLKTNVYCRLGFFLVVGRLVFAMLPDFHLGTEPTRFDETLFTDSVEVSQHFLPRDHFQFGVFGCDIRSELRKSNNFTNYRFLSFYLPQLSITDDNLANG